MRMIFSVLTLFFVSLLVLALVSYDFFVSLSAQPRLAVVASLAALAVYIAIVVSDNHKSDFVDSSDE